MGSRATYVGVRIMEQFYKLTLATAIADHRAGKLTTYGLLDYYQGGSLGRQRAEGRRQKELYSNLPLEDTSPDFARRKGFGRKDLSASSSSSYPTSDLLPSAFVAQRLLPSFDKIRLGSDTSQNISYTHIDYRLKTTSDRS